MRRLIQPLILATFICLTPLIAFADCQVTLHWGDSTNSNIAGYRLYMRTEFGIYDYDNFEWQGEEPQCTVPALDENTVYYFVIRAFDVNDNESADSNEVRFSFQDTQNLDGSGDPGASSGAGCFMQSLIGL